MESIALSESFIFNPFFFFFFLHSNAENSRPWKRKEEESMLVWFNFSHNSDNQNVTEKQSQEEMPEAADKIRM